MITPTVTREPRSPRLPADPRLIGTPTDSRNEYLYRRMTFIRRFEELLLSLFDEGLLQGTTHACIGQEANAVAVIEHLRDGDHVFSNHRCHGHYLAWTGDAFGLLTEIMGKDAGVCRGIGGSQHLSAPGFKSNGILGGTVPAAAGIAMAKKLRGDRGISLVFMGDGAMGQGVVYETLNVVALWQLPLAIVVEDNGWAQSTPKHVNMKGDIPERLQAFDIETRVVDSTDVIEIERAAAETVGAVRSTGQPQALVIRTYRLCSHSKNDDNRPSAEVMRRWEIEPLGVHGSRLGHEARDRIENEVRAALNDVLAAAREAQ